MNERPIADPRDEDKWLLTTEEVCHKLNIGRSKLLAMAYNSEIPSIAVGRSRRFPASQVREWVEERQRERETERRA